MIKCWIFFVYIEKTSESEGCVDQKAMDGERNESRTKKSEEPEKQEEKNGNQGKKDGKNKQCKHKREKELGEQGKPKTDVQDKDEMNSKEREQSEYFSDTVLIVLNNKVDMGMIGVIAEGSMQLSKLRLRESLILLATLSLTSLHLRSLKIL